MTISTESRTTATDGADRAATDQPPQFGFTLTKKVGNAVVRNRARRRLREIVRLASDLPARAGYDYVIVGRIAAVRLPFPALARELERGIVSVHARASRKSKDLKSKDGRVSADRRDASSPGLLAPDRIRPAP